MSLRIGLNTTFVSKGYLLLYIVFSDCAYVQVHCVCPFLLRGLMPFYLSFTPLSHRAIESTPSPTIISP